MPFVANVLIRAGKESGETSDMEIVLGGLASLNDEIEWFKREGSKWDVDFSTVVPQKANQEYRRYPIFKLLILRDSHSKLKLETSDFVVYLRFLEALMSSEVKYSVIMTAFWAIEAVYQESFAHCLEDGNSTPAELTGACHRWGNDGFKEYCSSVKNIAERCLENASGDVLAEAEDVLVRVLEHEVAFWEMSRGGQ